MEPEPPIQYAQTKDDVSIAFWTHGDGPALVQMPSAAFSPSRRSLHTQEGRRWYDGLADGRMMVRYDNRGAGESQQGAFDCSVEAQLADLDAVVERLGRTTVTLFGYVGSGPIAIAYASQHPERVSRLILWCTSARGLDLLHGPGRTELLEAMREADWHLFNETVALLWFGWSGSEQAKSYAASLRQTTTAEMNKAFWNELRDIDVSERSPRVSCPTLVLCRREIQLPNIDASRRLAAAIPGATLAILDGDSAIPYVGDVEAVLNAIDGFLSGKPAARASDATVHTILFTDMEGSTSLTRRLGDAAAQEVRRAHNDIVRDALKASGGSEIKHTGDGIMASFSTASAGLDCAIAIQRNVATYRAEHPDSPLAVYIGLNAGEPIAEDDPDGRVDLFGTSVDLAARLVDHAQPGQIIASDVVRQLAAGKGFLFADLGEVVPKGFEEPVRLYEVRWREEG